MNTEAITRGRKHAFLTCCIFLVAFLPEYKHSIAPKEGLRRGAVPWLSCEALTDAGDYLGETAPPSASSFAMYGHVSYRVATKRLKLLRQQLTLKSYKVVVCCARRQRVSRVTCLSHKHNILIAAKEFKRKLFTDFNTFNDPLSRFNCRT